MSILSSHVSPIPNIPPEQTEIPADMAASIVFSLSLYVWVLHISGKNLSDVSKIVVVSLKTAVL